jgi:aspartyl-tRNA(Asn)/glutamyl-tRNA(Gln) amidotransferase subunit A
MNPPKSTTQSSVNPTSERPEARDDLSFMPAWRAAELIAQKELSPVELLGHVLARIETLDPVLHTFSHVDGAAARTAAAAAEAAVMRGDTLGRLHGIPISVKDHLPVAGMPVNTHGRGERIARDGHFGVERLRAAGAVMVGLNTMLGAGGGGGLAGQGLFKPFNWDAEARNPWNPERVPGWSSSGGAAAVAAGILSVSIGTDGGGSTRLPAAYSGVVGVHPTGGLIPDLDYQTPKPPGGITNGPITRDVRDAALVTQVMAGPDGRDPFCIQSEPDDYLSTLDAGVSGMRFAWTDDYGFADLYQAPESAAIIALVRGEAHKLCKLGATVDATTEQWEDFMPGRMAQWMAVFKTEGLPMPSEDEMRSGFETRGRNWDRFRKLFRSFDLILSVTSQRVAAPIADWEAAWTTGGPTFPHGSFMGAYCSHTDMFNWLKFPAVSVPCGFVQGLPVGLQIAGPPGSEAKIFRAAQAFQHAFPRTERPRVS